MNVKDVFNAMVYGAAVATGAIVAKKTADNLQNPYKKAKIKKGLRNIKDAFTTNKESES